MEAPNICNSHAILPAKLCLCTITTIYLEESERLWIAGQRALRIVSIAIVRTLLESMQSISPSITVTVDDERSWIQRAMTDEISAAFDAAEWNIEYKENEKKLVIKSKAQ